MRNYIIHIGYHKTGTTWFQKKFFELNPNVISLPRKTIADNLIKPRSLEFDHHLCKKVFNEIIKDVDNEKLIVLSEEELSANPHSAGKGGYAEKELADRLHHVFGTDNTKIVIFVRNQLSIIQSSYNQYIKRGGTNSFKQYLSPTKIGWCRDLFDFGYFKYDKLVDYYKCLFGNENVEVFLYEDFKNNPKEFLNIFSTTLNLVCHTNMFNTEEIVNQSIPTYAIPLMRWSNSISRVSDLNCENMINIPKLSIGIRFLLKKLPKSRNKYFLSQETKEFINDYYRESNRNLSKICDIEIQKLKGYGYSV